VRGLDRNRVLVAWTAVMGMSALAVEIARATWGG
jgi:hypothetical protein